MAARLADREIASTNIRTGLQTIEMPADID
jgi:hypothetical protein